MPHGVEVAECAALFTKPSAVMTYDTMRDLVNDYAKCGVCHSLLRIVGGGFYGCKGFIVTCGNMEHVTFLAVEPKDKRRLEAERVFRGYHMKALQDYQPPEMAARINQAGLFPQSMTAPVREAIAGVCIQYGLDPLMGEIMLYQGKLYVTMAARLRKAQEAGDFAGISTRAATEEEKASRDYQREDYVMVAVAKKAVAGVLGEFEGWGVVSRAVADRADKHLPIGANPAQHAEKRAIARALRMAWHIPLPSAEDMGEDNGAEETGTRVVNVETGEVIDSTATELPPEAPPPPEKDTDTAGGAAKPKPAKAKVGAGNSARTEGPTAEVTAPAAAGGIPETIGALLNLAAANDKNITMAKLANYCALTDEEIQADIPAAYQALKSVTGWDI